MAGKSNIQVCNEKGRAVYEAQGQPPLLSQIAKVHGVTIREFASIFGISNSFAADVLNHKAFPSLELAVRISRYWEVTVEELFGWRIDDDGKRRPLLIVDPVTNKARKLTAEEGRTGAIELVMEAKSGCGDEG